MDINVSEEHNVSIFRTEMCRVRYPLRYTDGNKPEPGNNAEKLGAVQAVILFTVPTAPN
jgi:hypothetical protein